VRGLLANWKDASAPMPIICSNYDTISYQYLYCHRYEHVIHPIIEDTTSAVAQ
jgi:hypothetical protein